MTTHISDSSKNSNNNNGSSSGGRVGVAHGFGKDPPPSNPFGNYSFMEAQQQSSGASGNINNNSSNAGALGAGEQQVLRHSSAPAKENNPFLNYSFMEAQQQQQQQPFRSSTVAPESSSPITAGAGLETGAGFSQAHDTDRAEAIEDVES
ncbi:hypothetical protein GGI11_001748, partial [Coemansia sp. RSA 2049]